MLRGPIRRRLDRRTFLRGAGVSMALPLLGAMEPAFGKQPAEKQAPKRFVAMTLGLGLLGQNLYPKQSGRGWTPSRYLQPLEDLQDKLTLVSGSSHPGVTGGHSAEAAILTCNPAGSSGRAKNTISLDQYLAKHLGGETRFPSLVLARDGSASPCYTESGSMIPAEDSPAKLFERLFVDDSATERERQAERLRHGRSIMDLVQDDAKRLSRQVGASDRRKLDEYYGSVRELELRLAESQAWALRPKPKVDVTKPIDIADAADFIGRQRTMSGVIKLALQTDSTRFVAYQLGGSGGVVPIEGVEEGYHSLSHHGLDDEKLDQLALVEEAIVAAWGDFLRSLAEVDESGRNLLDSTAVLLTSNLGNASSHDNRNLPVVLGGGSFRHGQHLAFDAKNNYALPNLYVSLLQSLGMEVDRFATGTTTMRGLEIA
jgi:hypothetical protein